MSCRRRGRPPGAARPGSARTQRGSAAAEFVLIMLVLVPLFLGIFQVGLTMFVKNTLTACASEGARFGANFNRSFHDGAGRAHDCAVDALTAHWIEGADAWMSGGGGGEQLVVVRMDANVPPLGLFGPGIHVRVTGHAVKEN